MTTAPTVADWDTDPVAAGAAAAAIANVTAQDGATSTAALVLGIASQILTAAAPLAATAIGGPWAPILQAALASLSASMGAQSSNVLQGLTPAQQQVVQAAIQVAVQQALAKISPPKGT
jgi:hypothetical protein